ncbi:hypothetical protein MHB71_00075 [Paenibacillus sp. FSL H7-0940]|uniref:hypothetical protein n=1 Tax=Paenibacillus sp. FSL H7-0940 TaxID=2921443 RepID=UPI0030EB18AC
MVLLIIIIIIVVLFFPMAGLLAAGGIWAILSTIIPYVLVAILFLFLFVKIINYQENRTINKQIELQKYNYKMGIVTEDQFKEIVRNYEIHHTLCIVPFERLSDAQKKTALIRMIKKYPSRRFPREEEKYLNKSRP